MNEPSHPKEFSPLVRWAGYLVAALFVLGTLEFTAFAYYYIKDGSYIPVRTRLDTGLGNTITAAKGQKDEPVGCRWLDAIFPHPYLGYVVHHDDFCPAKYPNAQGLIGRDFPVEKQKDSFNILLSGGSVAMFLGQYFPGHPFYLEEALNTCYIPPKGNAFKVYNGAMGGYRQPQETIVFQLFGRAFDGLVTFEGANEYHSALRIGGPYGGPHGRFETMNTDYSEITSTRGDSTIIVSVHLANKILSTAKKTKILKHSFLYYFFVEHLVDYLEAKAMTALEEKNKSGKTTVESLLLLPEAWDRSKTVNFNIEQYKWHLINMHAMAKAHGIPSITFFQPVPSYYKPLTEEEIKVINGNAHDLKPYSYPEMIAQLMTLRNSHDLPLHSLLTIFEGRKETIYADPIHYEIEGVFPDSKFYNSGVPATGRSVGYEMVSAAMAPKIAAAFGLKPNGKCNGSAN